MSSVTEIKAAIDHLSFKDRCELIALLTAPVDDDWDRQMQDDAAIGKFDQLIEGAETERRVGTLRDFPKP